MKPVMNMILLTYLIRCSVCVQHIYERSPMPLQLSVYMLPIASPVSSDSIVFNVCLGQSVV